MDLIKIKTIAMKEFLGQSQDKTALTSEERAFMVEALEESEWVEQKICHIWDPKFKQVVREYLDNASSHGYWKNKLQAYMNKYYIDIYDEPI